MNNLDIIRDIERHLQQHHTVLKVKAHRGQEEAKNQYDLGLIMGNQAADRAAGLILQMDDPELIKAAQEITKWRQEQRRKIKTVLNYYIALNKERIAALKTHKEQTQGQSIQDAQRGDQGQTPTGRSGTGNKTSPKM